MDSIHFALTLLSSVFILFLTQAIYRLTLHPLARYPGPLLAKLSSLYAVYHGYRSDLHLDIHQCHLKYGNIVRYGPNKLIVNTVESMNAIYNHKGNVKKASLYRLFHRKGVDSVLTLNVKDEHTRRRRVVGQAFSEPAIKRYEPAILRITRSFVRKLADNDSDHDRTVTKDTSAAWSTAKDMGLWTDYLTFEVINNLVFSKEISPPEQPQVHKAVQTQSTTMRYIGLYGQATWLKVFEKILLPTLAASRVTFRNITMATMGKRGQLPGDKNDILQLLLDSKDPSADSYASRWELIADAAILTTAGSDTSSTAMAATLFYLARDAKAHEQCVREVHRVFSSIEEIQFGPALSSCSYLQACIDEAMRISPSLATPLWREVLPGGMTIDAEDYIPAGVEVGTSAYALHHNEQYFAHAAEFKPERWLQNERGAANRGAFIPFSTGPRNCVGKALASKQILLTMALIIYVLDFKFADEKDGSPPGSSSWDERTSTKEFKLLGHYTSGKEGPMLHFRERQTSPA